DRDRTRSHDMRLEPDAQPDESVRPASLQGLGFRPAQEADPPGIQTLQKACNRGVEFRLVCDRRTTGDTTSGIILEAGPARRTRTPVALMDRRPDLLIDARGRLPLLLARCSTAVGDWKSKSSHEKWYSEQLPHERTPFRVSRKVISARPIA